MIASIKRLPDGTVLVVEEVRTGRKTLALTSLRKYPVAKDFDSIAQTLLSNARSDNGDELIVAHQNPQNVSPKAEKIDTSTTHLAKTNIQEAQNLQNLLASNPEVQVKKAKEVRFRGAGCDAILRYAISTYTFSFKIGGGRFNYK